jgi:hypothetical protein
MLTGGVTAVPAEGRIFICTFFQKAAVRRRGEIVMKRFFLFALVFVSSAMVFAQFDSSYTVSDVYVKINTGYDDYYAEINSLYLTKFGKVKVLYKKARLADIGYGKYVIQLEHIEDDLFRIDGTGFILKILFANSITFSRFEDYILDISGISGSITKKSRY